MSENKADSPGLTAAKEKIAAADNNTVIVLAIANSGKVDCFHLGNMADRALCVAALDGYLKKELLAGVQG